MNRARKCELPSHLVLTSILSTSLTITLSIIYIVLSILAIVYRFNCDVGLPASTDGGGHFANMFYRIYIQKDDCESSLNWSNLTAADSVFLLSIITLCASVLTLVAAIALIIMIRSVNKPPHLAAYIYIGVCVASLVVDLTFATHFGMDFTTLTEGLNLSNPGLGMNYDRDMVRLGALLLMTVSLKGFVAHAINLVLLVLLVIYMVEHQQRLYKNDHSIHKLGALTAYDQPRRLQDSWQQEPPMFLGVQRGPQLNPAFIDDTSTPPRSPMQDAVMPDYSRSDSWQPGSLTNSRPFSYLEEGRKAAESSRRRDWPPPVPAPDYSPQTPRRLKSALKPSYM